MSTDGRGQGRLRQTWRWFGPPDTVSVDAMRQAGVEGVVTALHEIPPGTVWPPEAIAARQALVGRAGDGSPSGLAWEVVESLPVSEDIKLGAPAARGHVRAWRESLAHLAAAGIEVVCYNFMPVLDWTRTDLAWRLPHGGTCMRFDAVDFAVFDVHLLARAGAAQEILEALGDAAGGALVEAAARRHAGLDDAARAALAANLACGLPGAAERMTLDGVRERLAAYGDTTERTLRARHVDFLAEVAPEAERLGVRLCCHPDDPPWPLLGLPRVMSTEDDYRRLIEAVDLPANGITLCSGSLGARADNDLPGMMRRLGSRVHFLHLRNVRRETDAPRGSFHEAAHLDGSTDMVALVAEVLAEERRRRDAGRDDASIPMRPDHGQDLLDDLGRRSQPGYPAIGRLRGLAELRGVAAGLSHAAAAATGAARPR